MRALIIYKSRHSSTEKIALYLQQHLPIPTDLLHYNSGAPVPDLKPYDVVIIGGSVYMGQIQSELKTLCRTLEQELLQKQLGLFICCMNTQQSDGVVQDAFPEALRAHARAIGVMGGELLFDRMSFMEKAVILAVTGQKETVSKLNYQAMDTFLESLCAGIEATSTP